MGAKRDPWPCVGCSTMMLGPGMHSQQSKPRQYARHEARDLCTACYQRQRDRTGADPCRTPMPRAVVLEEWRWLSHDRSASRSHRVREAAGRLGMTPAALDKALRRAGVAA